jgi:hypothetical protein
MSMSPDVVSPADFDASPRHARDRLLLVTNDAMRARRRPRALAIVYAWQALSGLAAAWPVSALVRDSYGHHPRGDAVLFDPGGLALTDLVMRGDGISAVLTSALVILLASSVLGLFPMAALVVSIGHATPDRTAPPTRAALERAAEAFGPLVRLLVVFGLTQIVLLALGFALGRTASSLLAGKLDDAAADLAGMFVFGVFLLGSTYLGVLHDVARCAAIRFRAGAFDAIAVARRAMRPSPVRVVWSWAWRGLAGLLAVGVGAFLAHRIGGRSGFALVVLALVHQAIVVAKTGLRASWLARALRLVDQTRWAERLR